MAAAPVLRGALAALVLLGAILAVGTAARALPVEAWATRLQGGGAGGPALVLAGGALATAAGVPRQLVASLAGFAFGAVAGFGLALVAATGGCALTMLAAGRWFGPAVRGRWPGAVRRMADLVREDLFAKVIVLRLQPLGTNLATNLAAGVLAVRPGPFLAASFIGYVPQTLVFALAGSGVRTGSRIETLTAAGLFVVSLGLGTVLVRRHRGRADVALSTGPGTTD